MTQPVLGIDIAKAKFDVVLLVGTRSLKHEFANTPAGFAKLSGWLAKYEAPTVHACLEATGSYGLALAEFLHQAFDLLRGDVLACQEHMLIKRHGLPFLRFGPGA